MLKKIPFNFEFFDAYSKTDYHPIFWKWKKEKESSLLNNAHIIRYQCRFEGTVPRLKRTETLKGNIRKITTKTEYIEKCEMIEFICIPFSTEKERKQKKGAIKKEYKSSFFNFNKKVKHYTFKRLHLVVIIRGTDTEDLSKHKFPKIEFKTDTLKSAQYPYDAFINHHREDRKIANELCDELEKNGLKCWIEPRNIRPGEKYMNEIFRGFENSKTLVVIFSKNTPDSIYEFLIKQANINLKPTIAFIIEGTAPPDNLKSYLENVNLVRVDSNVKDHFNEVIEFVVSH